MTKRNPLYLLLTIVVLLSSILPFTSCNKKDNDDDTVYSYSTSTQTTLVTSFGLQADADVLASLDSVYFTVDYDRGLIYNADSLPVGTDISGLKVKVNFQNTVSSAIFSITGATSQADTTIEYTASMSKKLDFTGKTLLTVTSADKSQVKEYEVKVLVHKANPDLLVWPMEWRRDLPGYSSSATGLKTVQQGEVYRTMVYNGTECKMLSSSSLFGGSWSSQTVDMPFTPQVSTLTAIDEALFILAEDGTLYASTDGTDWASCGVIWHNLLGAYEDRVLGILSGDDGYYHDEYPHIEDFIVTPVEDGFPVSHSSDMIQTDYTWSLSSQAMLVGGYDSDGKLVSDVWGYDGEQWAKINNSHNHSLPALADATLFSYCTYKKLPGVRRYGLQQTWYVMGGRLSDGTLNGKIYLSNTQGIVWTQADTTIVQPDYVPKFYGAQAFVNYETMSASVANNMPRRVSTPITTWECPFIYLMGGYNEEDELLPYVWRGVFNRMTNYPVY